MTEKRRAPVQADPYMLTDAQMQRRRRDSSEPGAVRGTVDWGEHFSAWESYAKQYGRDQSAERMADRGGFGWYELVMFLGREPTTWEPIK